MALIRYGRMLRRTPAPPDWIEVSGFKSIRNPARVHLRPLTLLAGANSSGKSSVMQPLMMMKQTLEAAYDPGPLLLDGPHVRFSSPDDFLSRGKRKDDFADAVEVVFGPMAEALRWPAKNGSQSKARGPSPIVRFTFSPSSRKKLDYGLAPVEIAQKVDDEWVRLIEGMTTQQFIRAYSGWDPEGAARIAAAGDLSIQAHAERFSVQVFALSREADSDVGSVPGRWHIEPVGLHLMWLSSMLHLPGLRGHRERRYEAARVGMEQRVTQVPGPFTAYVASMVIAWQDGQDERLDKVNSSMQKLGLTWKVHARRVSAAEVELKVGRTPTAQQGGANDLVAIADVGFGVSQVLPVVVALVAARKGQLVYVEQPELHLHPRAQYAMGLLLAEAAQRGVRVVVETHSRMILRAIQVDVARAGGLRPAQVGLHWFSREPSTGYTTVQLADLDRRGAFGEWPVDFADVEAEADDSWLDVAFGGSS